MANKTNKIAPQKIGKYIIWFDQVDLELSARVGSKATNLARLSQAGFAMPDGFCITVEAYDDFLRSLDRLDFGALENIPPTELAEAILSSPSPIELQAQVLDAYQTLRQQYGNDVKVAVRSSASVEDLPAASFAGQYTSILNVTDEASLFKAIRQCWLSASTSQVQAYQTQHKLENLTTQMAVIVQVMIPADFAGVLFTIDPLAQDRNNRIVVEMTPGLGDSVASGTVMPLNLTLDKKTGAPVHSSASVAQSGVAYTKDVDWKPLCELALQAENLFQSPQDIEWAYGQHQFWLLQSRPITTELRQTCRQIWTRANAGEILPKVVSPLTWSIFKPTLQMAGLYRAWSPLTIHWEWRHPCGTWPDSPRLFRGRAYMELASVYTGFGNLPGVNLEILQRMLGFEFHLCRADEFPKRHPRWHVMDPYRFLRFWLEMLNFTKTLSGKAKRWSDRVRFDNPELFMASDVKPEVILDHINRILKETAQVLGLHIQCTSMAFSAFGLLDRLVRKYTAPEVVQEFEASLIGDFQNISTVQQLIVIWDLAQTAKQVPQIKKVLFEIEDANQVIEAWRRCYHAADFMNLWDSFITRFGSRSTEEFELAVAHWEENPTFVLQTMREIINNDRPDPRLRLSQQQKVGEQQIQVVVTHIDSSGVTVESRLFHRLVASFKRFVSLRENMKYCVVSRFNVLRKMFLTLGCILEQRNLISHREDIFFLRYEEVVDLIRKPEVFLNVTNLIVQRRDEYKEYSQSSASDVWVSLDGQDIPMELPQWQDTDVLQGIGCSPGRITGSACVLTSVQETVTMTPDQILVAPSIDPGLTPFFLSAAGLVTEIGGVLSHGATVAREYGLPAVVGVPYATKLIQNGQQITVDGFTGFVHLGPTNEE